MKIAGLN